MSEQGGSADPVAEAAARLEAAVERLAEALGTAFAARRAGEAAGPEGGAEGEMVPRAEVAALADRLDATVARLRGVLAEELRRAEED